jgi:hypothetical protein
MGWRALANRPVVLDAASLILAAAHDPTRVNAASLAADVDAAYAARRAVLLLLAGVFLHAAGSKVLWVAREAVQADAGAVVVVRDTTGVGSTLHIAAGVNTAVLALN